MILVRPLVCFVHRLPELKPFLSEPFNRNKAGIHPLADHCNLAGYIGNVGAAPPRTLLLNHGRLVNGALERSRQQKCRHHWVFFVDCFLSFGAGSAGFVTSPAL